LRLANGLLDSLESSEYLPRGHPKTEYYSEEFYLLLPTIHDALAGDKQG